jgi:hypothetical protein
VSANPIDGALAMPATHRAHRLASAGTCVDDGAMHASDSLDVRAQRWLPACLASGMSASVAAVVTAINTGLDACVPARWLLAWAIACPRVGLR